MMRQLLSQLKNIRSVGIELEGGYCTECLDPILNRYYRVLHMNEDTDGSVYVEGCCRKRYEHDGYWGEDKEIKAWTETENLSTLFKFVEEVFRSGGFKQNGTCGNHLHVRFKQSDKWRVFQVKETWMEFIGRYRRAFREKKYINRLQNSYCSSDWAGPDEEEYFSRYRMINFESLNEQQQTLEFRILPYFASAREAERAYERMLTIIDGMAARA